jgi:predicted lipoprotein
MRFGSSFGSWSRPGSWPLALAVMLISGVLLSACTVVPIEEVEALAKSEEFDPTAYVDGVWENEVRPTIVANAVDLPTVLYAIEDDLEKGGAEHGIFIGGAYNFMVKGSGVIEEALTESKNGTVVVDLEGYDGPGKLIVQVGPLIRGNSVRDATGLIEFGEFKEQTEFGQVSKAINKRVASDVLGDIDLTDLQGKTVDFDGTFSVSTINQTSIDLSEITVTPVTFEVE